MRRTFNSLFLLLAFMACCSTLHARKVKELVWDDNGEVIHSVLGMMVRAEYYLNSINIVLLENHVVVVDSRLLLGEFPPPPKMEVSYTSFTLAPQEFQAIEASIVDLQVHELPIPTWDFLIPNATEHIIFGSLDHRPLWISSSHEHYESNIADAVWIDPADDPDGDLRRPMRVLPGLGQPETVAALGSEKELEFRDSWSLIRDTILSTIDYSEGKELQVVGNSFSDLWVEVDE